MNTKPSRLMSNLLAPLLSDVSVPLEVVDSKDRLNVSKDGHSLGWRKYNRRLADYEVPENARRVDGHDDEVWVLVLAS